MGVVVPDGCIRAVQLLRGVSAAAEATAAHQLPGRSAHSMLRRLMLEQQAHTNCIVRGFEFLMQVFCNLEDQHIRLHAEHLALCECVGRAGEKRSKDIAKALRALRASRRLSRLLEDDHATKVIASYADDDSLRRFAPASRQCAKLLRPRVAPDPTDSDRADWEQIRGDAAGNDQYACLKEEKRHARLLEEVLEEAKAQARTFERRRDESLALAIGVAEAAKDDHRSRRGRRHVVQAGQHAIHLGRYSPAVSGSLQSSGFRDTVTNLPPDGGPGVPGEGCPGTVAVLQSFSLALRCLSYAGVDSLCKLREASAAHDHWVMEFIAARFQALQSRPSKRRSRTPNETIAEEELTPMQDETIEEEEPTPTPDEAIADEEPTPTPDETIEEEELTPTPDETIEEEELTPTPDETIEDEELTPTPDATIAEEEPTPMPDEAIAEEEPTPTPDEAIEEEEPTPTPDEAIEEEEPTPTPDATIAEEEPTPTPDATIAEEEPTPTPDEAIEEEELTPTPDETIAEEEPTPDETIEEEDLSIVPEVREAITESGMDVASIILGEPPGSSEDEEETLWCPEMMGLLYLLGGRDGTAGLNRMASFDLHEGKWKVEPDMAKSRCDSGIAQVGGMIYACGGQGLHARRVLRSVERFDPMDGEWKELPPMKQHRCAASTAVMNGCVYLCGGLDETKVLRSMERFNPLTDEWEWQEPMRWPRFSMGSGATGHRGGRLYVCGGCTQFIPEDQAQGMARPWSPISGNVGQSSSAEFFEVAEGSWEQLPDMPAGARCSVTTVVFGTNVVFCGGVFQAHDCDGEDAEDRWGTVLNVVESIDSDGSWFDLPPMRQSRSSAIATVHPHAMRIVVCGGHNGFRFLDSVETLAPGQSEWEELEPMHQPRSAAAYTSAAGFIYVFGGRDERGPLDSAERFNLITGEWEWLEPMPYKQMQASVVVMPGADPRAAITG